VRAAISQQLQISILRYYANADIRCELWLLGNRSSRLTDGVLKTIPLVSTSHCPTADVTCALQFSDFAREIYFGLGLQPYFFQGKYRISLFRQVTSDFLSSRCCCHPIGLHDLLQG
jgi:hypothetical protein